MRVLALAHHYIPAHCAGAETMLHSMLRALAGRGHDVRVILSRPEGPGYELDGVVVVPEADKAHVVREVAAADVVVTHLENTPRTAILGRLNGTPVVQVLHNTMQITRDWLARERPAVTVVNSQWMAADVTAWFAARGETPPPMVVVRPLVDPAEYRTTPGDRVTLVNLRRMESSDGGAVMGKGAEVFWALAERMPDVGFLGVRGGYGGQLVRGLPNVEVLDHVTAAEMRDRVFARTRVLLMPSSYESWGRVGTEAMHSGIPVVAHPTPGLLENLSNAGIFVDRDDVDGWVAALRALERPEVYAAASLRALARAAELRPDDDMARWCEAVEGVCRGGAGN